VTRSRFGRRGKSSSAVSHPEAKRPADKAKAMPAAER